VRAIATAAPTVNQRRTPPTLRTVLAVIGWVIAAVLVAGGAWTLLNVAARHTFTARASYGGVRSLLVDASDGSVHLTAAPAGAQLTVTEHVTEGLQTPARKAVIEPGGALHLSDSCSFLIPYECGVSYQIAVPSGVGVSASSGAGDVGARGLVTSAAVQLSSGAGDVSALGVSSPQVKLDSGAGDVTATLTSPPQRLEASSGAGDVTLTLPNVRYDLHASSGAGTVHDSRMQSDPSAPRRIDASSGAGDVTIEPAP
jgi:putative adhesin